MRSSLSSKCSYCRLEGAYHFCTCELPHACPLWLTASELVKRGVFLSYLNTERSETLCSRGSNLNIFQDLQRAFVYAAYTCQHLVWHQDFKNPVHLFKCSSDNLHACWRECHVDENGCFPKSLIRGCYFACSHLWYFPRRGRLLIRVGLVLLSVSQGTWTVERPTVCLGTMSEVGV